MLIIKLILDIHPFIYSFIHKSWLCTYQLQGTVLREIHRKEPGTFKSRILIHIQIKGTIIWASEILDLIKLRKSGTYVAGKTANKRYHAEQSTVNFISQGISIHYAHPRRKLITSFGYLLSRCHSIILTQKAREGKKEVKEQSFQNTLSRNKNIGVLLWGPCDCSDPLAQILKTVSGSKLLKQR